MAYTTIDDPTAYFQTKLYAGNGSSQSITFDGNSDLQPDWVWIKSRTDTRKHNLYDVVRGTNKRLVSNANSAEDEPDNNQGVNAFNSDGFTVGSETDVNGSSRNFVSWNWKAGTSFTNDASATGVGTIDSTGSIITTAGFSIISYTGTGSVGTVAHGIDTPKMILFKNRTTASNWLVYHEAIGNTHNLYLDATNGKADRSDTFNDTSPTSSVFTVGTADLNTSGNSIIAYCFAEKQGYSKFGSYTANNSSNGTFIYTGFKPSLFICKKSSGAESWYINDNKRGAFNPSSAELYADNNQAEGTGNARLDLLSNGVKMRTDNGGYNTGSETYIYMAFAESPFVSSTGVPATAR